MRREIHNLSMLTFPSVPNHVRPPAANNWPGLGEPWKSTFFFRSRNSTNWLFSNPPKSSAHASGAWRYSHLLVPFPIWGFYFDICEWHILPACACAWTPALMLHLTNPCAKRKVLSLTKPKGKIYKTKSLGYYITLVITNLPIYFCPLDLTRVTLCSGGGIGTVS